LLESHSLEFMRSKNFCVCPKARFLKDESEEVQSTLIEGRRKMSFLRLMFLAGLVLAFSFIGCTQSPGGNALPAPPAPPGNASDMATGESPSAPPANTFGTATGENPGGIPPTFDPEAGKAGYPLGATPPPMPDGSMPPLPGAPAPPNPADPSENPPAPNNGPGVPLSPKDSGNTPPPFEKTSG